MATTYNTHTGNGVKTDYLFTFPYLATTDVKVSLGGSDTTAYTFANATTIAFNSAPDDGVAIKIYRDTADDTLFSTFYPGSSIRSSDLNDNFVQNLYVTQESSNEATDATTTANGAVATANTASTNASAANTKSDTAVSTANTASSNASNAVSTANSANSAANTAVTTANNATTTANTASTNASTAITTANNATSTANTALSNSRESDGSGGYNSAISIANEAKTTADGADSTASTAYTTANSASSTANAADSNATSARMASDRLVATTNNGGATWTLAGNNTNDSTDPKGVGYAVTTAETASTNATTASANATAALDNSRESDGSGGWTSSISVANSATTTANAATTTANTAKLSTDRLVATTSDGGSTWTLTGNNTDASTDPKGVGYAVTTAEAAESAVANAVLYSPKGTTALWAGGTYTEDDFIEIADSSGLEAYNTGTTPKLSGLPADFEGAEGLTVRLQYTHSNTTFTYKSYFANDSEDRYMGIKRGYIPSAPAAGQKNYFVVKVATKNSFHRYNGTGASNGYTIDGQMAPFLELVPGVTYRFDQSDSSNTGHTLKFYEEADKVTAYTTGVTVNGTAGSSGAYTQIVTTDTLPTILHYMCDTHAHMGNAIQNNTAFDRTTMPIIDAGDFSLTSSHAAVATTYDGGAFT